MRQLLLWPALLLAGASHAQTFRVVTGTVADARTQAVVPFASLAVPGQPGGTVANTEGLFRLALPAGADSVRVQALGYLPLMVGTKNAGAALTVRLQPQPYPLQEVTVTALAPTTLLKRAVRQTTARMASPVGLEAYYREFTSYNGQIVKFADALVDYYLKGNPRRPRDPEVQVRVRESRAGETAMSKDDARRAIPSPLSVERAGNYYDVTEGNPYLDSTAFKFYSYVVLETPAGATEAPYYEVRCMPTTQDPAHLRQATVCIDRQTLAIQRVESEIPTRLQPYLKSINLLVIKIQATQARKRIEYRELNGRLYPSFMRLQVALNIMQVSNPTVRYEFTSEMLVRDLAASPAPFPKSEQHSGSLFKRGTHFTRPYWREGNVVPATAAEEAAIQALEKGVVK